VDQKDINIRLENGTLSLKGERKFEREEKNTGFHHLERSYGSFQASVLTVTSPKKKIAKPKVIKVQVNNN
jgi:HSP20 family protein